MVYKTGDLSEASYLKAKGRKIVDVIFKGKKATFLFEDVDEMCRSLIMEYINGDAMVNAKCMMDAQRGLKDLIFTHSRS